MATRKGVQVTAQELVQETQTGAVTTSRTGVVGLLPFQLNLETDGLACKGLREAI